MRTHISTSPIRLPNPAGRSLLICVLHRLSLWALVPKSLGSILSHALRTPFVSQAPRTISFICLRKLHILHAFVLQYAYSGSQNQGNHLCGQNPAPHFTCQLLCSTNSLYIRSYGGFLYLVLGCFVLRTFVLLSHCFRSAFALLSCLCDGHCLPLWNVVPND
ncbi:uncharacterized protein K444DRAFT_226329 [Hyaloscypha bicolor E]|uniref:Uncharacterized protein n=1 Tax=Hyaloscypha bicolor E TaxID=1095630 RepID=A0A2J6SK85_9HELO|nr:uncharacterized protein K444DRAFT_226329 [Hyaloscypha bicolor E]PMD51182.1 hypothetical protein K444DRAFT_226329 [Hyaloscypha bicolor E]